MGPACQYDCIHGIEYPPFTSNCQCDPCYSGSNCDTLCSNVGQCMNDTCLCEEGYKGDHCEQLDCPGWCCILGFSHFKIGKGKLNFIEFFRL